MKQRNSEKIKAGVEKRAKPENTSIVIQVPIWVDDFFKTEAVRRTCSKSFLIREIITQHVLAKDAEPKAA